MPWLDTSTPLQPAISQWKTFFKNALSRRLPVEQLPLEEMSRLHSIPEPSLASVLMGFRSTSGFDEPLLFHYADRLLREHYVGTADILTALLSHSSYPGKERRAQLSAHASGLPSCEERMLSLLAQMHVLGKLDLRPWDFHQTSFILTRWMHIVTEHEMSKQLETAGLHTLGPAAYGVYEALASLAITIFSKPTFRGVVQKLQNFDMHVLQWMQSHLGGRLQALAGIPPFVETNVDGRPIVTGQQIVECVSDLPVIHTKAGLYIYINACLCARPLTDDLSMLGYLQARYNGDNQTLAVDLLTASFDVLANALLRKERNEDLLLIRSFICNKIPTLLAMLSRYLAPMTAESCIQMAFIGNISMDVLPPISAGDKEIREILKRTRLEFLQACALFGLVAESTIATITQEPVTLPKIARYNKDGLVAQCSSNLARFDGLLEELKAMQGNASAIAGCLVQVVNNLCSSKDTMSLKGVCNSLIKHVPDMDIVLQYAQPGDVVYPLAVLLHDWAHDQDQTEFTPSYEEFASILLFTLAFIHRYSITKSDVPALSADNFVFALIQNITSAGGLSDEQNGQLSKWIDGLFATDEHDETSGISDEVMRQCPPQDFYRLVPSLFEHSVLACRSGLLSIRVFKGGLELLLEPFLLPSLIGGLSWLTRHSFEDHGDADVLLQVLDKLLKPPGSSQDTQAMHKAVLVMVAAPLTRSLQDLLRKRPDKKAAAGLIEILKPYTQQVIQRTAKASRSELLGWIEGAANGDTARSGLIRTVQSSVSALTSWMQGNPPPAYTHRLVLAAIEACGTGNVLSALVEVLKNLTTSGSGPQALDVCAAIICAPCVPVSVRSSASLRDELQLTIANTDGILEKPLDSAEALVRLARKVEAQLTMPQLAQLPIALPIQEQSTDQIMQDLGLTTEAGAAVGTDAIEAGQTNATDPAVPDFTAADLAGIASGGDHGAQNDLSGMPAGGTGMSMDFDDFHLGATGAQGSQQPDEGPINPDEDIFAGLEMSHMGDIEDFNF
ncbi:mediator of RNA polymerase II transcription subunit 5-like [Teratosphaeria destructans]|uniref:Mediator of RNA polymerase II transcription subunit 5 n=1 Tax=Teratosphaeria destructans TaxID=418781 RepID=A0A9W7STH6_9PEZI|nr:mediator of RNA polymerase II transcription subunit 5-like [Teratosphaeria destructans]